MNQKLILPLRGIDSPARFEKLRARLLAMVGIDHVDRGEDGNLVTIAFNPRLISEELVQDTILFHGYEVDLPKAHVRSRLLESCKMR